VRYQIEGVFLVGLLIFLPRHNAVFELQLRAAFAESAAEGNFGWVVIDLGTCVVYCVSIMGMGARFVFLLRVAKVSEMGSEVNGSR